MYLPMIRSFEEAALYQIGTYLCVVGTDCEAANNAIEYIHVIIVLSNEQDAPVMALAAESNPHVKASVENGEYDGPTTALGLFPGIGHATLDWDDSLKTLSVFIERGLTVVRQRLQLEHLQFQQLPHEPNRRVPFYTGE